MWRKAAVVYPIAVRFRSSVANPTILLVDLQLVELLRQLIYHIRSYNCGLCAPRQVM